MARSGLLGELHPALDGDYVSHFQQLADLNLELKKNGPSPELLLRKSMLEGAAGNYRASHRAAQDARLLRPDDPEYLYQVGISGLLLAYAEVGAVECLRPAGPLVEGSLAAVLDEAAEALEKSLICNPGDQDARRLIRRVRALRKACPDDDSLRLALQSDHDSDGAGRPARPRRRADRT
jgi:hypothetical protein